QEGVDDVEKGLLDAIGHRPRLFALRGQELAPAHFSTNDPHGRNRTDRLPRGQERAFKPRSARWLRPVAWNLFGGEGTPVVSRPRLGRAVTRPAQSHKEPP